MADGSNNSRVSSLPAPPADMVDIVESFLIDLTGASAVDPDQELDDLGLDSMAKLELLARLEARFNIEMTEDTVSQFRTLNRISRLVRDAVHQSVGQG